MGDQGRFGGGFRLFWDVFILLRKYAQAKIWCGILSGINQPLAVGVALLAVLNILLYLPTFLFFLFHGCAGKFKQYA